MLTALIMLAAASGQPAQAAPPANDLNKVVCKKVNKTGSRLGSTKLCMTKGEWEEKTRRDQQDLKQMQAKEGL